MNEENPELNVRKSCDACTRKKVKCDGNIPICTRCSLSIKNVKYLPTLCTYSKRKKTGRKERETEEQNKRSRVNKTVALVRMVGIRLKNESFDSPKFDLEGPKSQEMGCVQALCELKTANQTIESLENFPFPSKSALNLSIGVPHSIPENSLVGTKTHVFLFTFVKRTSKTFQPLLDMELIQMTVGVLSRDWLENVNLKLSKCPTMLEQRRQSQEDSACWAYFLAAIRLGSLQSDDFEIGMQQEYYKEMNFSLQKSYGEQRKQVILAHLLVAFFCFFTSQSEFFRQQSACAKDLINCPNLNVPHTVKNAFFAVVFGSKQLLTPPSAVECALLRIFSLRFQMCSNTFRGKFPHLAKHMHSSFENIKNFDPSLEAEFVPTLSAFFEETPAFATVLMIARFFQKTLLSTNFSKEQVLEALTEMNGIIGFVLKASKLSMDAVSSTVKIYILQIECFKCLFCSDLQRAKSLLATILDSIDLWMIRTVYFTFGEILVHQIHFLIAAAALLGLDCEFRCFSLQINKAFAFTQRQLSVPRCILDIYKTSAYSLCICEQRNLECSSFKILEHLLNVTSSCKHEAGTKFETKRFPQP